LSLRYLLDTSALILLRDGLNEADDRLDALELVPAISVVSHVELEGGIVRQPHLRAARRIAVDRMLMLFPVLPFDHSCVAAYRSIVEQTGFSRRQVIDRMIAATALVHGLGVVTTNPADFADVPGLDLEVWPAA
jgi:tRNA(fMet)-specific endonuclease VapC